MDAAGAHSDANAIQAARSRYREAGLGHFIAGSSFAGNGARLPVIDPASGETIADIPSGSGSEVERAVDAARAAFSTWRAIAPGGRMKTLLAVADVLDAHAEELAVLETANTGKPLSVSRAEPTLAADVFRFAAGAGRALQAPATDEYVSGYVSMIRREPVGVVGAITPWNYPLLTAVFKIAGALAAGNTMVLKPSEMTPLTTLRFAELTRDILPAGVFNVVLGTGADVGSALSRHPGVNLISLTGSVASGQRVMSDSARTLKPTHLELGGKAPVIVFDDADLDRVVEGVRAAGFWNSGQECGAATRILCSYKVHDALVDRLLKRVATLKFGGPTEGDDIEIGPLISRRHLESVAAIVDRAKMEGAAIPLGGVTADRAGYFFLPTVITNVAHGSEIARQEVFGPVVTVETFADEAEAVRLANDVLYGLSASVWTESVGRALRVSGALDFGTVWINTHLVLAVEMPWGGYNASGHGRELSTLSFDDFSRTKHVMLATGAI